MKKSNKIYNSKNTNERNSNVSGNTIKKNVSQDKPKSSNFTEVAKPQAKKLNEKQIANEDA